MKKIRVNDKLVSFREIGDGPVLLLLHGFGVGSEIWDHCIDVLSKKYTVLLLDLPGYGLNKNIEISPDIESITAFVREFIEERGAIEYVVGYSMSGLIVIHMLENYLVPVKKILLIATPIFTSSHNLIRPLFSLIGTYAFLTSAVCFLVKRFPIKQAIFMIGGLASITKPQAMNECMRLFAIDTRLSYIFRWASTLFRTTSLHPHALPVAFIYGEFDGFATASMAKEVTSHLPNSSLYVIKDAYHILPLEKPQELAQRISAVLSP